MKKKRFTTEKMSEMIIWCNKQKVLSHFPMVFEIYNMDFFVGNYPGELIDTDHGPQRARSFQSMVDLADAMDCHIQTPIAAPPWTQIIFIPRSRNRSWHTHSTGTEKYGVESEYHRINKLEDPSFVCDFKRALEEAKIHQCKSIIDLGVNTGDELDLIFQSNPSVHCTGVDHCASALEMAQSRCNPRLATFHLHDINKLEQLYLERYDLLISLGTLHSPGIDAKRVFMWCMQQLVSFSGSVIIGFPNCRWVDGQAVYGAKTKNRTEQDLSLVIKDIYFVKKYLQQHKFRVTVFGKYYLFVVGVKITKQNQI